MNTDKLMDDSSVYGDSLSSCFGDINGYTIFTSWRMACESLQTRARKLIRNDRRKTFHIYLIDHGDHSDLQFAEFNKERNYTAIDYKSPISGFFRFPPKSVKT